MPLNDNKPLKEQILHGEHLTSVDEFIAGFKGDAKEDFLKQKALERKAQYDDMVRRQQTGR